MGKTSPVDEYKTMREHDNATNKILSPSNLWLVKLWEKMAVVAGIIGGNHIDHRLQAGVLVYERYLPRGSPIITEQLFQTAKASKDMDLFEKKAALISHGSSHPFVADIARKHVNFACQITKKQTKKEKKAH